jgi:hypothetical protein
VFITPSCQDTELNQPYVDVEQPGTTTDPATNITVSYTYVHGGFTGTNTKFAFYFPAPTKYQGRFFESTYPTVSQEAAAPSTIVFGVSNGAYVVSSNNNGGVPAGAPLAGYRANAAAAKYSRVVAAQLYGNSAPTRGYLYGGSGGAYQTLGAAENTDGVWQGTVPFVPGVPNAIPSFQASELLALRVLGPQLPQIADAMAPGGSGNPYVGLKPQQQSVLTEVSKLGFPLRGWWQYATLNGASFFAVEGAVKAIDPNYVTDFWTASGYEGSDPSVQAARIQYPSTVTSATANSVTLPSVPVGDIDGADINITSGAASGQSVPILGVSGNTLQILFNPGIAPGDSVTLDNSWVLALQYYPRHQVPSADQYGWNQYRDANGNPIYPQRPILVGPILAASAGGAVATGDFHGKMIMLGMAMDTQAYPWSVDWYRQQAQKSLGSSLNANFRVWYMDHADHEGAPSNYPNPALASDNLVDYSGEIQQALLDLDAWVAKGKPPTSNTSYQIDSLDQVQLSPPVAASRGGIQPVVTLDGSAPGSTGGQRVDIQAGTQVTLAGLAQVPPGQGKITKVEWDLEGTGNFTTQPPQAVSPVEHISNSYTFTTPGTYFATVRVTAQRNGDTSTPYTLVQNLATVRVVVH